MYTYLYIRMDMHVYVSSIPLCIRMYAHRMDVYSRIRHIYVNVTDEWKRKEKRGQRGQRMTTSVSTILKSLLVYWFACLSSCVSVGPQRVQLHV